MAHYDKIPFRGWFAVGGDGQASRLRTIPDVTMGRHPEHPRFGRPDLGDRCDACGHQPLALLWHPLDGELSLCGHHATALDLESRGWVAVIDRRQTMADAWLSNTVA